MSAITNPTTSPVAPPGQVAPPSVERPPEKKSRRKLLILGVVLVLVVAGAYQLVLKPRMAQKAQPVMVVPTAKATVGALEQRVRLSGQTSSRDYADIVAPRLRGPESRNELVLLYLIKSGSRVKKGDLLASIDAQGAYDHIDDVKAIVESADSDVKKRKAEQAIDWENLQQTVKVAKADLDKAKLDASAAEVRTVIDQELLKLSVEEAEAHYNQVQKELALRQEEQKAEIRVLELTKERHIRHLQRHVTDVEKYTIRSPIAGLAVTQPMFRGGQMDMVQQGDQVHPGRLFLKVVDTSRMQVECTINQAESSRFRLSEQATIGLDAFPGLQFKGKIYSIGAMAKGGRQDNYYVHDIPVNVAIDGSDPRLIPDLSAYVDVLLHREENVLRIPRAAVFREQGKPFVFVKQGGTFVKKPVELGFRNETHVAVVSGLDAGADVALARPTI
jgi:HlyD family secretion protein